MERDRTYELQAYDMSSRAKLSLADNERFMNNTILNYITNCEKTQIYNNYPNVDIETDLLKNGCIERDICYYNSKIPDRDGIPNQSGEWLSQFEINNRIHNDMVPAIFNENTKKHFVNTPIKKLENINHQYGDIYGKLSKY